MPRRALETAGGAAGREGQGAKGTFIRTLYGPRARADEPLLERAKHISGHAGDAHPAAGLLRSAGVDECDGRCLTPRHSAADASVHERPKELHPLLREERERITAMQRKTLAAL